MSSIYIPPAYCERKENPPQNCTDCKVGNRQLSREQALAHMIRNVEKALEEHRIRDPRGSYPPAGEISIDPIDLRGAKFSHAIGMCQGAKKRMEDYSFYQEREEGILFGVFDGHGGADVAAHANRCFADQFFAKLGQMHLFDVFEQVIHEIHCEVLHRELRGGSTVVVSWVDKRTSLVYTATVGDSEAHLFQKAEEKVSSIPLSCVRDWGCPKEWDRHQRMGGNRNEILRSNPKNRRFPGGERRGPNLSRSIGDRPYCGGIIHKPKITVRRFVPSSLLLLASDGLRDGVGEEFIREWVDWTFREIEKIKTEKKENLDLRIQEQMENLIAVLSAGAMAASKDNIALIALRADYF